MHIQLSKQPSKSHAHSLATPPTTPPPCCFNSSMYPPPTLLSSSPGRPESARGLFHVDRGPMVYAGLEVGAVGSLKLPSQACLFVSRRWVSPDETTRTLRSALCSGLSVTAHPPRCSCGGTSLLDCQDPWWSRYVFSYQGSRYARHGGFHIGAVGSRWAFSRRPSLNTHVTSPLESSTRFVPAYPFFILGSVILPYFDGSGPSLVPAWVRKL